MLVVILVYCYKLQFGCSGRCQASVKHDAAKGCRAPHLPGEYLTMAESDRRRTESRGDPTIAHRGARPRRGVSRALLELWLELEDNRCLTPTQIYVFSQLFSATTRLEADRQASQNRELRLLIRLYGLKRSFAQGELDAAASSGEQSIAGSKREIVEACSQAIRQAERLVQSMS